MIVKSAQLFQIHIHEIIGSILPILVKEAVTHFSRSHPFMFHVPSLLLWRMYAKATKGNHISDIELNFRVCFADITASIATE